MRLIDADALAARLENECREWEGESGYQAGLCAAAAMVAEAPTVKSEELTKTGYSLIIDRIVNRKVDPPQGLDVVELLNWCSAYAQCQNDIVDIIEKLRDSNGR